jgi:hypothetical protein
LFLRLFNYGVPGAEVIYIVVRYGKMIMNSELAVTEKKVVTYVEKNQALVRRKRGTFLKQVVR